MIYGCLRRKQTLRLHHRAASPTRAITQTSTSTSGPSRGRKRADWLIGCPLGGFCSVSVRLHVCAIPVLGKVYQGNVRRAAGFCNGRLPDFEFLSNENGAIAFQRSAMRATRRAHGITLEMWSMCISRVVVRGGRANPTPQVTGTRTPKKRSRCFR